MNPELTPAQREIYDRLQAANEVKRAERARRDRDLLAGLVVVAAGAAGVWAGRTMPSKESVVGLVLGSIVYVAVGTVIITLVLLAAAMVIGLLLLGIMDAHGALRGDPTSSLGRRLRGSPSSSEDRKRYRDWFHPGRHTPGG